MLGEFFLLWLIFRGEQSLFTYSDVHKVYIKSYTGKKIKLKMMMTLEPFPF